jgi:hypothetical protein
MGSDADNPMKRLVPYLDLFVRLDDRELARLAGVEPGHAAVLRKQVTEICEGLAAYVDLLPRLDDEQLARLTGAQVKTIRFWRLCQPRTRRAAATKPRVEPAPRPAAATPTVIPREEPVADWSGDSPNTDAGTMITASRRVQPPAQWDTTAPISGTATMITPRGQTPDAQWARRHTPATIAETPVDADPAQRQQSAAQVLEIAGEPFPGYEEYQSPLKQPPPEEIDEDFL